MRWFFSNDEPLPEQQCVLCGSHSSLIALHLRVCGRCIRQRWDEAKSLIEAAHTKLRQEFGMPPQVPQTEGGVHCSLCARRCIMGEGELGYCGLRMGHGGRLVHMAGIPRRGLLHWYRDPLPTNCVAMGVCAGQKQEGYHNLAVFYGSCTFNCLFCQNWHYRDLLPSEEEVEAVRRSTTGNLDFLSPQHAISADELVAVANSRTFCVCYFGGDPASQMPHALASATKLAKQKVTICWETSGGANPRLMDRALALSLRTNGTVKFDLKAYNEHLHIALTGISNRQTLENFERAARHFDKRSEMPLIIASTLLVPGYVDAEEVGQIARFIAGFSPNIPYVLLGFAPHFYMPDLPCTSVRHAEEAEAAAHSAGLTTVRIGNRHLLSHDY
jgi:pyruvate formate lyase activating enzyme